MVYIDKKYPSQQGEAKKNFSKLFSIISIATMALTIICFVVMCVKVDKSMANQSLESLKYLWNNFAILILTQIVTMIATAVLTFIAKKSSKNSLVAPTYITALDSLYFVVVIIVSLIYMF